MAKLKKNFFTHLPFFLLNRIRNFFAANWKEILVSTSTSAGFGLVAGGVIGGMIAGGLAIPTFGLGVAIYPIVVFAGLGIGAAAGFFSGVINALIRGKKTEPKIIIPDDNVDTTPEPEMVSESNEHTNDHDLDSTSTSQITATLNPETLVEPQPVIKEKKPDSVIDMKELLQALQSPDWKKDLEKLSLTFTQNEKIKVAYNLFALKKHEAALWFVDSLKLEHDQVVKTVFNNLHGQTDIKNLHTYLTEKWKWCSAIALTCYSHLLDKTGARPTKLFKILGSDYKDAGKIEENYSFDDWKNKVTPHVHRFKSHEQMQGVLNEMDDSVQKLIDMQKIIKANKEVLNKHAIDLIKETELN